jgi:hypothetical protein
MRTKTLLVAAAAIAVGLTSSMAQVYSQNVVGYVNIPLGANQKLIIANQLNTTNNTIGSLLPNAVPGSILSKFNAGFSSYVFDDADLVWTPDGNATLNPGEAAFYQSPSATTLTFVGEVRQGSLTNALPPGIKVLRSSIVPQGGAITTALGLPGEGGDILNVFSAGFNSFVFDDADLIWTPSEPNIAVGQGFFYQKSSLGTVSNWVRNFTVN